MRDTERSRHLPLLSQGLRRPGALAGLRRPRREVGAGEAARGVGAVAAACRETRILSPPHAAGHEALSRHASTGAAWRLRHAAEETPGCQRSPGPGLAAVSLTSPPAPLGNEPRASTHPFQTALVPPAAAPCSRNPSPGPGGDGRAPGAARVPGAGGGEQSSAGFARAGGEEEEEPMVCRQPRGCGESIRQPRQALPREPSGGSPGWQQPVTVLQAVPAHLSPQVSPTRRLLRRPRGRTGRHAIELAANPLLAELRCGRAPEKGVAPSPRVVTPRPQPPVCDVADSDGSAGGCRRVPPGDDRRVLRRQSASHTTLLLASSSSPRAVAGESLGSAEHAAWGGWRVGHGRWLSGTSPVQQEGCPGLLFARDAIPSGVGRCGRLIS